MEPKEPTVEDYKERLDYDPDTGMFRWSTSKKNPRMAGKAAGTVATNGYVMILIFGKRHLAHRIAWFMTSGKWPTYSIDHINRDRQDNRIKNLRDVPHWANVWNQSNKDVLVGAKQLEDGSWASVHMEYGEQIVRGGYDSADAANLAFIAAQEKVHNPFGPRPKLRPISQKR